MAQKVNFISVADAIQAAMNEKQTFMLIEITEDTSVRELAMADGFVTVEVTEPKPEPKPKPEQKEPAKSKKQKPKPEIDHGKIMALHKAGWSSNKIAGEMGISAQTVLNHIARDEKAKQEGGNEQ